MTAQISDLLLHRGVEWTIIGIKGTGLFDPKEHGLVPVSMSSNCWRGFHCGYVIEEEQLRLGRVTLSVAAELKVALSQGRGPTLFGSRLRWTRSNREEEGDVLVDPPAPIPFTGGLLLGDGFLPRLAVNMGFPAAWKFQSVRELLFENGLLLDDRDLSAPMEEKRTRLAAQPLKPGREATKEEREAWLKRSFSLDYESP